MSEAPRHGEDDRPGAASHASPDALRRELRDLGYLKNPLESFVAGRITGATGLLRTAVLVGTRVGLLGGVLIGVLATAGLLILQPDLVRSPLNAAIVSLYLVLIFAIVSMGIGIVGVVVLLLLHRATRRFLGLTRAAAHGAGILAGVLSFVYLALLYRKTADDLPSGASVAAVALVLLVSLLFGRMMAAGSYVFLVRLSGGSPSPSERRTGVVVAALSVVGVASFFLYLGATAPRAMEEPPSDPIEVRPTGERVLILAVDGPTTDLARAAVESDRLPNVRRLVQEGSTGILEVERGDIAPSFWTTVSTGRTSSEHGVRRYSDRRMLGMDRPLDPQTAVGFHELLDVLLPAPLTREVPVGAMRGGPPTIFDVVGQKGTPIGVMNWRASWPAAELPGFVVSDVAYFSIASRRPSAKSTASPMDAHPPSLLGEIEPLYHAPAEIDLSTIADPRTGRPLFGSQSVEGSLSEELRIALSLDGFASSASVRLLDAHRPDLAAVYLPGLAILERKILAAKPGTATELREAADVMDAYECYLDERLGRIVEKMGPDATIVFLSFPDAQDRAGLFALAGPSTRRGTTCGPVKALDVAPTALALLGFPASLEMRGRLLQEALTPEFLRANPERRVRSFGARAKPKLPSTLPEDSLENMRAVGYLR